MLKKSGFALDHGDLVDMPDAGGTNSDHDARYYTETELSAIGATPGCEKIGINTIGTPTWTTQCDHNKLFGSVGRATGGTITYNGDNTSTVTAGTGFIKATDSDTATLLSFDWAEKIVSTPASDQTFIGVEYNGGSPQVTTRTSESWDLDTEFSLGTIVREGGHVHILNNPWWVTDGMTNILERFQAEGQLIRDNHIGGLIISGTGTRNVAITAGTVWSRLNEFAISAFDSAVTGTFETYYRDGSGSWTVADVTQYPVTQYDNGSGTLQNMNVGKYANWWVYLEVNEVGGELAFQYPQQQYNTSAQAEAGTIPTPPLSLSETAILVGRIIFKQGTDAPIEVQSAFVQQFTPAQASDHGNLAGLSDDDHTQYAKEDGTRMGYAEQYALLNS